jgi:hypothetical protein
VLEYVRHLREFHVREFHVREFHVRYVKAYGTQTQGLRLGARLSDGGEEKRATEKGERTQHPEAVRERINELCEFRFFKLKKFYFYVFRESIRASTDYLQYDSLNRLLNTCSEKLKILNTVGINHFQITN